MSQLQSLRGMVDLLPEALQRWQAVEAVAREHFRRSGFGEIRTPLLETTDLFCRGIGEGTDVVGKEMYSFQDRGDRSCTLRPEGTASVVRAALQHGLMSQGAQKLWYAGPMNFGNPDEFIIRQLAELVRARINPALPLIEKPLPQDDPLQPDPATAAAPHRVFNIGNSQPIKLLRFISVMEQALGREAIKDYQPMQLGDVVSTAADTQSLKDWVDFQPLTPIEVGIQRFTNWYRGFL